MTDSPGRQALANFECRANFGRTAKLLAGTLAQTSFRQILLALLQGKDTVLNSVRDDQAVHSHWTSLAWIPRQGHSDAYHLAFTYRDGEPDHMLVAQLLDSNLREMFKHETRSVTARRTQVQVNDPVRACQIQSNTAALEAHEHDRGLILCHECSDSTLAHRAAHATLVPIDTSATAHMRCFGILP